ncbi:MAG: ferritin-like domain-containing protein [Pseudomonadota bacterium]
MQLPVLGATPPAIKDRPLNMLSTDAAAVRAIAQAAVSVELFTIPLYMNSMYSIYGTHQINSKKVTYYTGRQWPGMSTTAKPETENQKAFNIIFSVFIQEMLHLQMAANLATAIGVAPSFTGTELQSPEHGWKCYGPALTVIPHIVDLGDTESYQHVRVNLEDLNDNQCDLFLAIEQPEQQGRDELRRAAIEKNLYFPAVPLAGWTPQKTAGDLPLFGTIGYMYECFAQYISMQYTDGQTLWQKLYDDSSVQQDMFNVTDPKGGHPKAEYPHFATSFSPAERDGGMSASFNKAIDMMCAITDQGEGASAGIKRYKRSALLTAVQPDYREDRDALEADYPSYTNDGCPAASRDAAARADSAADDHYERFGQVRAMLPKIVTWKQWHADPSHRWTKEMLVNPMYDPATAPTNIPAPEEVAGALNRLKAGGSASHETMSTVSNGAIYGITSILDGYWGKQDASFPYPSMVGSGDRMSICWAVFGQAPNLAGGVPLPDKERLYHACQGMNLDTDHAEPAPAACAAIAVYHSCRGSNGCRAQGGCGFAQIDIPGKPVSLAATPDLGAQNLCGGGPTPPPGGFYSAPSDNRCATYGGCAVPISASQLFPNVTPEQMLTYNFGPGPDHRPFALKQAMTYALGENVYSKAWEAFSVVQKARGETAGPEPKPTDLRLALPPST